MSRREIPQRSARRSAPSIQQRTRSTPSQARTARAKGRSSASRSQSRSRVPTTAQSTASRSTSPQRKLRVISAKPTTGRFKIGNQRRRIQIVVAFVLVMLIVVTAKVVGLQTAGGDSMRAEATNQWTRTTTVIADRGTIFDRNGEELAVSIPAATISINPKLIDNEEATLTMLATMLSLDVDEQQRLYDEMVLKDKGFVYVRRQVDADLGNQIAALKLSGVNVDSEPTRLLPGGDTGRSVIGQTDIDGVGTAGLEKQYDDILSGQNGSVTRQVAPGGRSIAGTEDAIDGAVPGDDLILTIDRSIQFTCEQALLERVGNTGSKAGTCIVMDADSGELYAMASVKRDVDTNEVLITSGNHAAVDSYEPGSVAKVITIAAGLETGVVGPDTVFEGVPWRAQYGDDLLRDSHEHPDEDMTVRQILVESSNIGTIMVQEEVQLRRHWDFMRKFGLGESTALDFPGESAGIFKEWNELYGSEKYTVSYGQGLASTPIQLISAVNAIANDGLYVAPKLVRGFVGDDGEIVPTAPSATHEVVSTNTALVMQSLMTDVVCLGTATRAQVSSFNVAGKTGTGLKAQPNGGYEDEFGVRSYYASFVGFFPAEDPQITVLISIDEPPAGTINRFGGTAAAPVFARLVPTIAHELGIQPPSNGSACAE
ncbi:MAG: penicillin-binding protein 2 [Ilumatobacteraceae bacterium]|nr:penicillin-binding protein 2 [Ilumatobacteraceae bacterium]